MLKDFYLFHKKSTKIVKSKQYKAWRGENNVVPDYTLPASYHVDHWQKELEKIKNAAKMMDPNFNPLDELKKEEVKMPTKDNLMQSKDKEKEIESNIKIPGMTSEKENKKPLIMEMESEKYTPNHEISHVVEDGLEKVVFVF